MATVVSVAILFVLHLYGYEFTTGDLYVVVIVLFMAIVYDLLFRKEL